MATGQTNEAARIGVGIADAIGRRDFLRLVALGAAVAVVPGSALAVGRRRRKTTKTVYRLSTHKLRVCNACKAHGANKVFLTRKTADKHRSHDGCNCKIVKQEIDRKLAKSYFKGRKKVFELRRLEA